MLVRPQILPDEVDRSYLGAVMRLNGLAEEEGAAALMAEWLGVRRRKPEEAPIAELLSRVADTTPQLFVQQHTTLPFRRGITSRSPLGAHGSLENRTLLSRSGMRTTRSAAYFCIDCVVADQSSRGRSYWRREHQMPGLYWCPKHRIGLHHVEGASGFLRPPSEFLESASAVDNDWAMELQQSEQVRKFLDICSSLMDTKRPFSVQAARDALRLRAKSFGYLNKRSGEAERTAQKLLSDEILESFPRDWLTLEFPSFGRKRPGCVLHSVDGVLWSGKMASSVNAYALATSVLFEIGDQAIDAFLQPARTHAPQTLTGTMPDCRLCDVYVRHRGNYASIEISSGSAAKVLLKRLYEMGLPDLIPTSHQSLLVALNAFFVKGQSIEESAAAGNVGRVLLEEVIRRANSHLHRAVQGIAGRAIPTRARTRSADA